MYNPFLHNPRLCYWCRRFRRLAASEEMSPEMSPQMLMLSHNLRRFPKKMIPRVLSYHLQCSPSVWLGPLSPPLSGPRRRSL